MVGDRLNTDIEVRFSIRRLRPPASTSSGHSDPSCGARSVRQHLGHVDPARPHRRQPGGRHRAERNDADLCRRQPRRLSRARRRAEHRLSRLASATAGARRRVESLPSSRIIRQGLLLENRGRNASPSDDVSSCLYSRSRRSASEREMESSSVPGRSVVGSRLSFIAPVAGRIAQGGPRRRGARLDVAPRTRPGQRQMRLSAAAAAVTTAGKGRTRRRSPGTFAVQGRARCVSPRLEARSSSSHRTHLAVCQHCSA
jgi:hypothetical protein